MPAALCDEAFRKAAGLRFKKWPSAGDVADFVRDYLAPFQREATAIRALIRKAEGTPPPPMRLTEEEQAREEERRAEVRARVEARERARLEEERAARASRLEAAAARLAEQHPSASTSWRDTNPIVQAARAKQAQEEKA